MKKLYPILGLFILSLFPAILFAQSFSKNKDTIDSNADKGSYTAKFSIPKAALKPKSTITFSINKAITDVTGLNVPVDSVYIAEDSTKNQEATYTVTFNRDHKNDKKLSFNVSIKNPDGTVYKSSGSNFQKLDVHIRSYRNFEKTDNEYWIFIGTNFDLLDGVKANDLYFKGSFLVPIDSSNPKKHQLYISFEKNRFFSDRDSLTRVRLTDVRPIPGNPDSLTMVQGYYNTFRETITENLGFSLSYIKNLKSFSNTSARADNQYNLYLMAGFYIDHQTRILKYTNHSIQADSITVVRDSNYRFTPLASEHKSVSWNNNLYFGLMYIHSGTSVNLKTFMQVGANFNYFPAQARVSGLSESITYSQRTSLYTRFHLDATLLESPGLSFGAEVYLRRGLMPLFNFTATKVFDLRQLKTLFSKLPSQ
jgi:hypothetical protein